MNWQVFWTTFFIIAAAELGDKTQLFTLGLAARYPLATVLAAVLAAAAALMALAVIFGQAILNLVPGFYIHLAAGLIFIFFGLWMILEKEKDSEKIKSSGQQRPFWIAFSAFFLAELGDKTQVAALTLSAQYGSPLAVWLGATLGMAGTNVIASLVGGWFRQYLPEKIVKWLGAIIFIGFGAWTLASLFFSQL